MSLYDDLGVPKGATLDQIKAAYRRLAQQHHPDRPGGNAEKFRTVTLAYEVLTDVSRRKLYDMTGGSAPQEELRPEALGELAHLLERAVAELNIEAVDIVAAMVRNINGTQEGLRKSIKGARAAMARNDRVMKKLRRARGKGDNLLLGMLEGMNKQHAFSIEQTERQIAKGELMKQILADYEYDPFAGDPLLGFKAARIRWVPDGGI